MNFSLLCSEIKYSLFAGHHESPLLFNQMLIINPVTVISKLVCWCPTVLAACQSADREGLRYLMLVGSVVFWPALPLRQYSRGPPHDPASTVTATMTM
jgi:hypothetical protein